MLSRLVLLLALCSVAVQAFLPAGGGRGVGRRQQSPLRMGRAAAVRANTKAKTDAAKAKNNGRYAKKIINAVRAGGPDPELNRMLGAIIAEAQRKNVPKDIIKRNIDKANKENIDYKESIFEFYGFGGVSLLVNVLTDNDNRATADVNLVAKKQLVKSASSGSALFNFNRKVRLDLSKSIEEDDLMELCLELEVDDYDLRTEVNGSPLNPSEEGKCVIFVDGSAMAALRDALRAKGYEVDTSFAAVPKDGPIKVSDEDFDLNMAAIDAFEALDDVDSVEHNIDMTFSDDE